MCKVTKAQPGAVETSSEVVEGLKSNVADLHYFDEDLDSHKKRPDPLQSEKKAGARFASN
jgi:hypothetical protein